MTVENPDLASPSFKANPFDYYSKLRADAPVHRVRLPDKQTAWLISRYDDAHAMLKDGRLAKDKLNTRRESDKRKEPWVPSFFKPLTRNMLDVDSPDHTRLRA